MKTMLSILMAVLFATAGISAAGECKGDRDKLCAAAKGDMKAMHECMKTHDAELSPACKTHRAENLEKNKDVKKACKADYKKLCKSVKPGQGRIISCLKEKDAELSPGCKSALSGTNIEH